MKITGIALVVDGRDARVDSRVIAGGLGVDHRSAFRQVLTYEKEMAELGQLRFEIAVAGRKRGGNPGKFALLNEAQAIFLMTLSKNTGQVVALKLKLTKAFDKYRRQAERRTSLEWQSTRADGKVVRRQETDTVKRFVVYARSQGSKNADKYYMAITKMQNAALFLIGHGGKPGNLREAMTVTQLSITGTADNLVDRSLDEGMDMGLFYKDVYKLAKQKIEQLAAVLGKSPVPSLAEYSLPRSRGEFGRLA